MEILKNKINKYTKKIWYPDSFKKWRMKSDSWFDIIKYENMYAKQNDKLKFDKDKLKKCTHRCKKVILLPNKLQSKIILMYMDSYIKMYNATNKLIKEKIYKKEFIDIEFMNIRTNYMFDIKEKIFEMSGISENTKINKHILDEAIRDVCTSYKSALENMKQKNIKHFRIRNLKHTKPQKIIKIQKDVFNKTKTSFCSSVLGNKINTLNDVGFKYVDATCTLVYNSLNNRFTLHVPIETKKDEIEQKYNAIGLDPGIRTFLTGYSESNVLKICNNLQLTIKDKLETIDKINKTTITNKKKKKAVNKRYVNIDNLVNDLHWKTINYLTNNYHTILIGNLSTKGIVSKQNKLNTITKRIALMMRLFEFRERLKYKCYIKGCDYSLIKENYTTKMCSYCGSIDDKIGANKVYNCKECKNKLGRDVNASRNIFMLGLH
jgi:IS605 OrfB family transposase